MRFLFVIFFICLISLSSASNQTQIKYLSGQSVEDNVTWEFYCTSGRNSGKWSQIRVPSCWELEGYGEYNYGHDKNKANEKGLYKTRFSIPEQWRNMRIFIVFEGAMTDTKIKVNGKQAGNIHQGSFYRFKREISDLISKKNDNVLEVEVSKMSSNESVNSAERAADYWIFGGIYRPVYIEAVPNTFIEYSVINALHSGEFELSLVLDKDIKNAEIGVEIFESDKNKKVGEFSKLVKESNQKEIRISDKLENIKHWSAESPSLYIAKITLKKNNKILHSIDERFGFRTMQVRKHDGIYLNGKKIRLKGVNRHCFWPSTGRTVSRNQSLEDALLIKDMNMNAVRMSHYPPDKHFLEICDSLGLYVIDELCAWQDPPYDTKVGSILVREMMIRDVNHPCILFWANGNEGGFNFELDPLFKKYDLQKRPLLHPWGLSDGINTAHYINYNSGIKNMFSGKDIFMPTELLHGLYDGGHGAGLDDYWNAMLLNPLSAGLFLWDFSDQGVIRTDKEYILDTDKDHGADGILGPYREKEGSYYTIKEIWSPIYFEPKIITSEWTGKLNIENRYEFTNIKDCSFNYELIKYESLSGHEKKYNYKIESPDIEPGNKGILSLNLPHNWSDYDILNINANDRFGKQIFNWSFEVNTPKEFTNRVIGDVTKENVIINEDIDIVTFSASNIRVEIDKATGLLKNVFKNNKCIPLANGPILISDKELVFDDINIDKNKKIINVKYKYKSGGNAYRFAWSMIDNGNLNLTYDYRPSDKTLMTGITFDFPESDIEKASLFANGPYRVYNNRMKGGSISIWDKKYNDAITGEVWEYPEFKGYYSKFYALRLHCPTPFEVYNANDDELILHLFTPKMQTKYDIKKNYTNPQYPKGNISFMDAIPAVGTKFGKAENYGPQSQMHRFKGYSGLENLKGNLYFNFNID